MSTLTQIRLLAQYNRWMNEKLYRCALQLPEENLHADRHAFFGSLFATLHHIYTGDAVWLKRFATHPTAFAALEPVRKLAQPRSIIDFAHSDLGSLWEVRRALDETLVAWTEELSEGDLGHTLCYSNTKGVVAARSFESLVLHLFNHQTHHRGQATTLLSQEGLDVGTTDLLALIPDRSQPAS
ncbi:MAG: DinB family protein [Betaproteobacteria bacterium]